MTSIIQAGAVTVLLEYFAATGVCTIRVNLYNYKSIHKFTYLTTFVIHVAHRCFLNLWSVYVTSYAKTQLVAFMLNLFLLICL